MSATSFAARLYKATLSPALHAMALIPGGCRFQPTCSEYAVLALAQHGPWRGLAMTAWRLLRCHPLARGGWDPVSPIASSTHTGHAAGKGTIE